MMDFPSANRGQSSSQRWAEHNGWSPASPPGPLCNPLPSFQHLSLGLPSDQRSNHHYHHHWPASNQGDLSDLSPGNHAPHNMGVANNANHPNACAPPPMDPASSQGRTMPPCSLPPMEEGMQQGSAFLPHSPYQALSAPFQPPSAPFQPPCTHQASMNGPQPLHHLPANPPSSGPNQPPRCTSQAVFERPGVECAHIHSPATPNSPIQLQPQWACPPQLAGNTHDFAPNVDAQDGNLTPQSPKSESRYGVDPLLLTSAVRVCAEDRAEWEGKVFTSEHFAQLPPLATTSCIVEDRGNASPCAIRSTTYCVPCDGQTALLSRLPLGALVSPLSMSNPGEKPIPVRKEPECVLGCSHCGASMCPAMSWQDCGQRFYCPFCGKLSEVPWQHCQPTNGAEGARVDEDKRPELSMGSYEILASQRGEPAALMFAIDVSASALRQGHLEFVTGQIHSLLASLNSEDSESWSDVRVGLMTYNSRIHLYNLSPALSRPHMLVIMEKEDLQLPLREGLLVSLKDCIHAIDSVLQHIPQFSPERDDSCGVPVELPVEAGLAILQGLACPGKLLIFHTAPLIETGHANGSSGFFGPNKPKSIFQPSELTVALAKECIGQGCGIHLFALSQQDVGGAWPGHVPYFSGGALHTYSRLQGELDRERFSADLQRTVEMDSGYRAELRIFVSQGLRVSGCYGLFLPGPSPARVAMATVDRWTTLAVELAHARGLDEIRGAAIQTVLTYSSQAGDKRTRVHTLTLRCSRHLEEAFRHCQAQTLLAFYCKKMYCSALERPLQELRQELESEITEALASYRKHCSSASVSDRQLVLPQHLRALPVYINSLRKSEVLLPGLRSSVHLRLQQRCQVLAMDTRCTATHFYPLLLPLPLSAESSGPPDLEEALRCCAVSLEPAGLYLLHAPLTLLLWVGSQVPASSLVALFNASCFSSLSSGETKLPVLENPLSTRVRCLINTLNSQVPSPRQLWVVKQGDTCEEALQRHLVEDKSPNGGASYADFMYHIHYNSVRMMH